MTHIKRIFSKTYIFMIPMCLGHHMTAYVMLMERVIPLTPYAMLMEEVR